MEVRRADRRPAGSEPFPWFLLTLVAEAAAAVVAISAAHIWRFNAAELAREHRGRVEHEALHDALHDALIREPATAPVADS
jgi:hypothetical protein